MTPTEAAHHDHAVAQTTRVRTLHVVGEAPDRIVCTTLEVEVTRALRDGTGTPEWRAWCEAVARRRGLLPEVAS